ncbi:translation initiation factor IF-2-like [Aquila chrysaetos chrysaetos]|uniref:translation initiation factor IF-2-like n=1 Tax=Aquila chrysaetos chrysaetos TaxID=223781 RepID=UPI001176BD93|nr:translation initiation factor IF-2-like [Aquila chrysaetos chrysaetos]
MAAAAGAPAAAPGQTSSRGRGAELGQDLGRGRLRLFLRAGSRRAPPQADGGPAAVGAAAPLPPPPTGAPLASFPPPPGGETTSPRPPPSPPPLPCRRAGDSREQELLEARPPPPGHPPPPCGAAQTTSLLRSLQATRPRGEEGDGGRRLQLQAPPFIRGRTQPYWLHKAAACAETELRQRIARPLRASPRLPPTRRSGSLSPAPAAARLPAVSQGLPAGPCGARRRGAGARAGRAGPGRAGGEGPAPPAPLPAVRGGLREASPAPPSGEAGLRRGGRGRAAPGVSAVRQRLRCSGAALLPGGRGRAGTAGPGAAGLPRPGGPEPSGPGRAGPGWGPLLEGGSGRLLMVLAVRRRGPGSAPGGSFKRQDFFPPKPAKAKHQSSTRPLGALSVRIYKK